MSQSINTKGDIAGSDIDINDQAHGFLRTNGGRITVFEAPGAGSLGTEVAFGLSINAARTITGWYFDSMSVTHGFVALPVGKSLGLTLHGGQRCYKAPRRQHNSDGGDFTDDYDSKNVSHGFLRSTNGKITRLPDAPGEGKGTGQGTYFSTIDSSGVM